MMIDTTAKRGQPTSIPLAEYQASHPDERIEPPKKMDIQTAIDEQVQINLDILMGTSTS